MFSTKPVFPAAFPLLCALGCNDDPTGVVLLEDTRIDRGERGTVVGQPVTAEAPGQPQPTNPESPAEPPSPGAPPVTPGIRTGVPEPAAVPTCATDEECSGGSVCASGHCLPPCTSNADCAMVELICDFAAARCSECAADANCPGGQVCMGGLCTTAAVPEDDDVAPQPAAEPSPSADDAELAPEPALDDDVEPAPEPTSDDETPLGCNTQVFDPCVDGIPMMTATHSVDGDASDFCDVPTAVLELSSAPLTIGNTSGLPHRAEIRVAWTADALHLHAAVTDPNVIPEAPNDTWSGDSLDVYVASTSSVSGSLGNDGTPQLILAPPSPDGSVGGSAMRFPAQEQVTQGFSSRTQGDGYVVELSHPWPGGATLASGSSIRINFALNVREQPCADPSDLNACRQYYGAYSFSPGGDPSDCTNYTLLSGQSWEPWCDNRTWCTVTLR